LSFGFLVYEDVHIFVVPTYHQLTTFTSKPKGLCFFFVLDVCLVWMHAVCMFSCFVWCRRHFMKSYQWPKAAHNKHRSAGYANGSSMMDVEEARASYARQREQTTGDVVEDRMRLHNWQCGRFGLRWNPRIDLLNVPDAAGVYVLFFENQQVLVGMASNLFRRILQSWYAPGRSFVAFSWMEVVPYEAKDLAYRSLKAKSYDQLWEDIRPFDQRDIDEEEGLAQEGEDRQAGRAA
jgi:hypothetical protein